MTAKEVTLNTAILFLCGVAQGEDRWFGKKGGTVGSSLEAGLDVIWTGVDQIMALVRRYIKHSQGYVDFLWTVLGHYPEYS